jgi:hypothetical protein
MRKVSMPITYDFVELAEATEERALTRMQCRSSQVIEPYFDPQCMSVFDSTYVAHHEKRCVELG